MTEDARCCGSGTCIVDADGRCWCGQQWDGRRMCTPAATPAAKPAILAMPAATARDDDAATDAGSTDGCAADGS